VLMLKAMLVNVGKLESVGRKPVLNVVGAVVSGTVGLSTGVESLRVVVGEVELTNGAVGAEVSATESAVELVTDGLPVTLAQPLEPQPVEPQPVTPGPTRLELE